MTKLSAIIFCLATAASAQGTLPWGYAVSVPLLAAEPGNAIFYVSSYHWTGGHTDYDMARQAADAYLLAHPETPTYLVLSPALTQTCDAVPLPTVSVAAGVASSLSIIGYGSNSSRLVKRSACAPGVATLTHPAATTGAVTNALYQGFTVDANHVDNAACGFYGMTKSTFLDVACGNASPASDHEAEFGSTAAKSIGVDTRITIYNLKTFDSVGAGKGAVLQPGWSAGVLTNVVVSSAGTKQYTQQYTRAQFVGSDVTSCTKVPTVKPIVSSLSTVNYANLPAVTYGYVTGAIITNPGNCARTAHLYLLIQDGVPVTFGMKFSYTTMSHMWNLEPTGNATYGEAWLPKSGNNQVIGEHPYTNQTFQIADYAVANQHLNTFFDSPGAYGAVIYGATGAFVNPIFTWDGAYYPGSAGYYFGAISGGYQNWTIQNSQCSNSTANFASVATIQGPLAETGSLPSGVTMHDVERCDGSTLIDWATPVTPQQ